MIHSIRLHNLRCFATISVECVAPVIIIEGANGSGKTSLLEAVHYACYLRSFRTHIPRDMIHFNAEAFIIDIHGSKQHESWHLHVGCSSKKRLIKLNGSTVEKYKEIVEYHSIVSILESDLAFITGTPEIRRNILDQAVLLKYPESITLFKKYRIQLEQRNALLYQDCLDQQLIAIWTEQLWDTASKITKQRMMLMQQLEQKTQELYHFLELGHYQIAFKYMSKIELRDTVEQFMQQTALFEQERMLKRTLFGPHLDDISISLNEHTSKAFASRGQQKLLIFLYKLAHCLLYNKEAILLLDDLLADFDEIILQKIVPLALSLAPQTFITTPVHHPLLHELVKSHSSGHKTITLP